MVPIYLVANAVAHDDDDYNDDDEDDDDDEVVQFLHLSQQSAEQEELFLATPTAISSLIHRVEEHCHTCAETMVYTPGSLGILRHVLRMKFICKSKHTIQSKSSPHVQRGKVFENVRVAHALLSSGMLSGQYEMFCEAANIGKPGDSYIRSLQNRFGYS